MSDRTEEASPKKKRDERKKGNVAKSKEAINAITFAGVVIVAMAFGDILMSELQKMIIQFFDPTYMLSDITSLTVKKIIFDCLIKFLSFVAPIAIIIAILGVIGNFMQTGFLLTGTPLKPKFSKLNPINGLKNIFSIKSLGNLVKSVVVIVVLSLVSYQFVKNNLTSIVNTGQVYIPYLLQSIIKLITELLIQILMVMIIIGAIDFTYQKFSYKKQLRMTKQEVKDEYKQQEGDPQIKGRIKQKQRQIAMSRTIKVIPEATVILANPTHISVAVRYIPGKDMAPVVIAKGADYMAFKIKEVAKEHDIPIIENKPLARALYKDVEIDREIPVDMYEMMKEVILTVNEINRKKNYKR